MSLDKSHARCIPVDNAAIAWLMLPPSQGKGQRYAPAWRKDRGWFLLSMVSRGLVPYMSKARTILVDIDCGG